MADLQKSIQVIFEGNDQASRKAADVIAKIREMEAQSATAAKATGDLAKSAEDIGKAAPAVGLLNAALAALSVRLVLDRFIEVNVQLEQFQAGLRAVNGSSIDAGKDFEYLRSVADRLGLSVDALSGGYVRLVASAKGTVLEGQATRDIFEAVNRAMAAVGASTADTNGALAAVTQTVSKGKVQMEELRGQLGDRLPGALQIAARAMGLTTAEFEILVKKGLAAEEFLPKFAAELNRTFASAQFDGYQSSMNRLRNAIDDLLRQAGAAGAFDALTTGVKTASGFVGELGVEFKAFGQVYEEIARGIRNGDFSGLGDALNRIKVEAVGAQGALEMGLNQTLAETQRLLRQSRDAATDSSDQFDAETQRLLRQSQEATRAINEVDILLKKLGVDPKKTTDGIDAIVKAIEELAANPKTNGEDFALAFATALKKAGTEGAAIRLGEVLASAFDEGKISAETYQASLKSLADVFEKVEGSGKKAKDASDEHAKAIAKQAEEMRKAEQEAQRMRLELEKIASNERIKNIEAKVKLNVAEIEAQTKRVEAAFESINATVNSTGDLLGDLFGLLKDYDNLSFGAIRLIEKQIETENNRRQEALGLQRRLIEAQVEQLKAQTRAYERGDSIIKIDGAGLQPHLEAFMWEILRQIQVRVNQDGLKLLLGV